MLSPMHSLQILQIYWKYRQTNICSLSKSTPPALGPNNVQSAQWGEAMLFACLAPVSEINIPSIVMQRLHDRKKIQGYVPSLLEEM